MEKIHVGKLIHILSHQMKRQCYADAIDCGGLTAMQKHVLCFILLKSMKEEVLQRDIEEEYNIRRSTATGLLKLLEKNGFIIRESVERDARIKRIVPTAKAETLREAIRKDIVRMENLLHQGISEEEYVQCVGTLQKMLDNISEKGGEYIE